MVRKSSRHRESAMKKSLAIRIIGGVLVAATMLVLPATATAAVRGLTSDASTVAVPAPGAAGPPFRISVPGAAVSGAYLPGQAQVTVTLKVTGRGPCGVVQLTRNGPADGLEWNTVGALCGSGTATFRTAANRLWGSRALPAIRVCNGDSLALAEGVDCDDYVPPRGA
jgi:hypothetical protein